MVNPMADINGEEMMNQEKDEEPASPESPVSPEESPPKEEKSPLEVIQAEFDDLNDRYLRLAADFDNFRKRSARDTEYRVSMVLEKFARDILDVADSLERALTAEGGNHEGISQIMKLLENVLSRQGITSFESVNETFDPAKHEAIAYVPSVLDEGLVCDEVCKGYLLNEKVIRCAKVAVSQGNSPEKQSSSGEQ